MDPITAKPSNISDVRLYRIWAQEARIGLHLRSVE
jgi:hypothetical protein